MLSCKTEGGWRAAAFLLDSLPVITRAAAANCVPPFPKVAFNTSPAGIIKTRGTANQCTDKWYPLTLGKFVCAAFTSLRSLRRGGLNVEIHSAAIYNPHESMIQSRLRVSVITHHQFPFRYDIFAFVRLPRPANTARKYIRFRMPLNSFPSQNTTNVAGKVS